MKRLLVILLFVAALAPAELQAGSASASMSVSAVVLARAVVKVMQQPLDVVVTAEDLRRGYVDVAEPFVVNVRTNSRRGYLLQVTNVDAAFTRAEIRARNLSLNVADQSFAARPYIAGGELLPMAVRLTLGPEAREGRYSFPIAVNAEPLN